MKIRFLSVFLFFCFATGAYGAIIESDYVSMVMSPHDARYSLEVIQNPITKDYTGIVFEYSTGVLLNPLVTVDEGSDWYLVSSGDLFNPASIAAGQFPVLMNTTTPGFNTITPSSANFFLAFNTGVSFADQEYRNIFGWVYLSDLNGVLTLKNSAITFDEGGILVGSPIPLPTSAIFLATSLLALGYLARTHNKKMQPMPTAYPL